jgi:uncharacterized protein (DUF885 family)
MKATRAAIVAAALAACTGTGPDAVETASGEEARAALDALVERHTRAFMELQPVQATVLDVAEEEVGGPYNNRLPDYSPEGMRRVQSAMANAARELIAFDAEGLREDDRRHRDIVRAISEYYAGSSAFSAGYIDTWFGHVPFIVNQASSPLISVPDAMQVQQRIESRGDADDYLARLAAFGRFTGQVLAKVKADETAGVILPRKLFPKTQAFFENFTAPEPMEHPLATSFAERLRKVEAVGPAECERLVGEATRLVRDVVYPGYREVAAFMRQQEKRAPEADGIWTQPGGRDLYRHEIRFLGDSELTPGEIHEIGLEEVEGITREMDAILRANGVAEGSVGQRMLALSHDPRFLYPDTDEDRVRLIANLNAQVTEIMGRAPDTFATLPKAEVEVRRVPRAVEASAPDRYTPPSLDGSRPGIYWINLRDMTAVPSFILKTITYHEAVPGHHFQANLNMANPDIGLLRQRAPFNAYAEGWGLYAELLARELGMYRDDPWGDLGRLQSELHRAVRLVGDTGLHARQWTREQTIDYFHEATGLPLSFAVSEVERYMIRPGQALGYKLGMLELVGLREQAREALGEEFDIRAFHDLLLLPGARPLSIVRRDVERWIADQRDEAVSD